MSASDPCAQDLFNESRSAVHRLYSMPVSAKSLARTKRENKLVLSIQRKVKEADAIPGRSYMVGTGWILYVPSCSLQPDSGRFFDGRIPVCSGEFQSEPTGNSSELVRRKPGRNPVARNM